MILTFIIALFILWVLFVNVMWAMENRDKIPKALYPIAVGIAGLGFLYDVLFNIVYGTIMFLQLPDFKNANVHWKGINFPTLSERMKDNLIVGKEGSMLDKYRWYLSKFLCRYLIEPWDKGHCGIGYIR
jgi:hypothetical protein